MVIPNWSIQMCVPELLVEPNPIDSASKLVYPIWSTIRPSGGDGARYDPLVDSAIREAVTLWRE